MRRIRSEEPVRYADDCIRIKQILLRYGWDATLSECHELWERHSEAMAAGWLFLPDDDFEVYASVSAYLPGTDANGRDV